MGLKPSPAVYKWTLKPSTSDFEGLFCDCIVNVYLNRNGHQTMSGAGFNGIEALRSSVLMDVKALGQKFRKGVI